MATALHKQNVKQLKFAHQSQILTDFVILQQCNLAAPYARWSTVCVKDIDTTKKTKLRIHRIPVYTLCFA